MDRYQAVCTSLGTLNGANLVLSYNKLKKLDEKVFKPLLTDLEVTLFIYGSKIHSNSINL